MSQLKAAVVYCQLHNESNATHWYENKPETNGVRPDMQEFDTSLIRHLTRLRHLLPM